MTERRGARVRIAVALFALGVAAYSMHRGVLTDHIGVVIAALVLACSALLIIAMETSP
jgi:hypothetical protein